MTINEVLKELKEFQEKLSNCKYAYETLDTLSNFIAFDLDSIIDAIEENIEG